MVAHSDSYIPPTPPVQGAGGPPLTLHTLVDSREFLNVGNANLFNISWGMIYNPQATSNGVWTASTEQGLWTVQLPQCRGSEAVTVNAKIKATWSSGPVSGPSWNWWDERDAFASALWAVMQAASNPGYEIYSSDGPFRQRRDILARRRSSSARDTTYPQGIQITAKDNNDAVINQFRVTYSTEGQSGPGGLVCDAIEGLAGTWAPISEIQRQRERRRR